jgi:signal transduction histidine kinase
MDDADLSGREERALATLGRLTRGALHEIANPLLALVGTAELALGDAEPGTKLHDRLLLVQGTGQEITEIVRALQGFAREQGAPRTAVALGDAAESAVTLVRRVSAVRDVELAVRHESSATVAIASPGEVACALVELLLDGLAGAARGDTVELVVSRHGGDAVAAVAGAGELRLPAETVS